MKTISFLPRIALLALAFGTASATASFAQTDTTPPTTPAPATPATTPAPVKERHHGEAVLTDAEKAQLEKDKAAALAANPDLQTEEDNLKASRGQATTADAKKAAKEQWKAYKEKLRAAELAVDPTLAPIFAKLDAAHKSHKADAGA